MKCQNKRKIIDTEAYNLYTRALIERRADYVKQTRRSIKTSSSIKLRHNFKNKYKKQSRSSRSSKLKGRGD